jgi:hypothetical protein
MSDSAVRQLQRFKILLPDLAPDLETLEALLRVDVPGALDKIRLIIRQVLGALPAGDRAPARVEHSAGIVQGLTSPGSHARELTPSDAEAGVRALVEVLTWYYARRCNLEGTSWEALSAEPPPPNRPAPHRRVRGRGPGDGPRPPTRGRHEAPARAALRRYTDVSFPPRVRVGAPTNLRVRIAASAPGHAHDVALDLEPPEPGTPLRVTVNVSAENFVIDGPPWAEIDVPPAGDSHPVLFRLRGEAAGPGRIMIDFAQDGRPLGSVDLEPEVVADADPLAGRPGPPVAVNLRAAPGPAPDVVLVVHEYLYQLGRLHFSLYSKSPALRDLPLVAHGDLGVVDLRTDVLTWVQQQLETLNADPYAAPDRDAARLAEVGQRLFAQLLPAELRRLCWTFHRRRVRSVMVYSDDPHIPWELIKPWRRDAPTGPLEELPFWGESYALGRWLRGPAVADGFTLGRVAAVVARGLATHRDLPADPGPPAAAPTPAAALGGLPLENADRELAILRALEGAGARLRVLPALREALRQALAGGDFDLLHLISHGAFGGSAAADASAVLMDDGPFTAGELAPGMAEALGRAAPLVVFNACSTGRVGYSLTRLGAWAAELAQLGCGGFVGSLWRVSDDGALAFAERFYGRLTAGEPIGEALRQARLALRLRDPEDPTWLAYTCFADPLARVAKPAAGPS